MKRAFKMKQKVFFIILKGLLLKQIKPFFWEGKSPTLILTVIGHPVNLSYLNNNKKGVNLYLT